MWWHRQWSGTTAPAITVGQRIGSRGKSTSVATTKRQSITLVRRKCMEQRRAGALPLPRTWLVIRQRCWRDFHSFHLLSIRIGGSAALPSSQLPLLLVVLHFRRPQSKPFNLRLSALLGGAKSNVIAATK